jgi:hypothetical protein
MQIVVNQFVKCIHPEWKKPLNPILNNALDGDIEETCRLVADLINQKIDIPGIQEEVELMMFNGFTRFAAAVVTWYLERKRA